MSSESSSSELIELLRQTREYARYLKELGAETFESPGVSARAETFVATVAAQPIEAPPAPLRQ